MSDVMNNLRSTRKSFWIGAALGAILSLVIHLVLGWEWTALAAIAVGFTVRERGWLAGSLAMTLGWTVLVAYAFIVAPAATWRFAHIFAGMLGNLPGPATVALTLLLPAMIGAVGGFLGSMLAHLRASQREHRRDRILV